MKLIYKKKFQSVAIINRFRMESVLFDVVSKLSELSCHFILILMFVYSKVPSL